jgi:hypothetical protein
MNKITRLTAIAALLGSAMAAGPSFALTRADINGEQVNGLPPSQNVRLDGQTHRINVQYGNVVQFDQGGQSFEWKFDGIANAVRLSDIAPQGMQANDVTVYVNQTVSPLYQ